MVGYIVNSYCLRFNRGVVCDVVVGYIVNSYCLRLNRGVVCDVVVGYIVNSYCLRLTEEWCVLLWLVILLTLTV